MIAKSCRTEVNKQGGFSAEEAALNQLLGDGRFESAHITDTGAILLGGNVVEINARVNQYIFPRDQPNEAYEVALPSQPTDTKAYLKPTSSEDRARIQSAYEQDPIVALRRKAEAGKSANTDPRLQNHELL